MSDACAQLEGYLDGVLDPTARAAFEQHVVTCARCGPAVEQWKAQSSAVRAWAEPPPMAPAAAARLVARARAGAKTRRVWPYWVLGTAVAAAAIGWLAQPRTSPSPALVLDAGPTGRAVPLGDDLLQLSAGAQASVTVQPRETRVNLTKGTSTFRVAPRRDGARFVVQDGSIEVRVVGTVFAVQHGAVPTVVVAQGVVEVWEKGSERARLTPGQAFDELGPRVAMESELRALRGEDEAPTPDSGEAPEATGPSTDDTADEGADAGPEPKTLPRVRPLDRQAVIAATVAGRLDDARKMLTTHLASAPRDAAAWSLMGDVQRKSGQPKAAVSAYRKAVAFGDAETANLARVAAASLLQDTLREPAAARALLEDYLKQPRRPLEAAVLVRLARLDIAEKHEAAARKKLERVIASFPTSPAAVEARELLRGVP